MARSIITRAAGRWPRGDIINSTCVPSICGAAGETPDNGHSGLVIITDPFLHTELILDMRDAMTPLTYMIMPKLEAGPRSYGLGAPGCIDGVGTIKYTVDNPPGNGPLLIETNLPDGTEGAEHPTGRRPIVEHDLRRARGHKP